jgi:hypothetical protein
MDPVTATGTRALLWVGRQLGFRQLWGLPA